MVTSTVQQGSWSAVMLSASFSRVSNIKMRSISSLAMPSLSTSSLRTLSQGHFKFLRVTQPLSCYNASERRQVQQCRAFGSEVPENSKVTAVALLKNLKHLKYTPPPALVLGLGGLIPFAAAPTYMIVSGIFAPGIAFAQVAYGACILSFLGGIRWGMTIPEETLIQPNWFNIGYSVTPPIIAWLGLLCPTPMAILTLIGGLAGAAYMDTIMWGVPVWFKALRFILSLGAILGLWTTLMCRLTLSEEKQVKKPKAVKAPPVKPVVETPVKEAVEEPVVKIQETGGPSSESNVDVLPKENVEDEKEYTEKD